MTAVESTGTNSEIKEQYEKYKKFVGGFFFIPSPQKGKITVMKDDEKR